MTAPAPTPVLPRPAEVDTHPVLPEDQQSGAAFAGDWHTDSMGFGAIVTLTDTAWDANDPSKGKKLTVWPRPYAWKQNPGDPSAEPPVQPFPEKASTWPGAWRVTNLGIQIATGTDVGLPKPLDTRTVWGWPLALLPNWAAYVRWYDMAAYGFKGGNAQRMRGLRNGAGRSLWVRMAATPVIPSKDHERPYLWPRPWESAPPAA